MRAGSPGLCGPRAGGTRRQGRRSSLVRRARSAPDGRAPQRVRQARQIGAFVAVSALHGGTSSGFPRPSAGGTGACGRGCGVGTKSITLPGARRVRRRRVEGAERPAQSGFGPVSRPAAPGWRGRLLRGPRWRGCRVGRVRWAVGPRRGCAGAARITITSSFTDYALAVVVPHVQVQERFVLEA
jgi:hypothetical protein